MTGWQAGRLPHFQLYTSGFEPVLKMSGAGDPPAWPNPLRRGEGPPTGIAASNVANKLRPLCAPALERDAGRAPRLWRRSR